MTVEQQIAGARDQFPAGMRVLAVDDDPTCLLMLEALLRKCQYHVTTTSQAVAALKMLRENRNRFDLVISDVHMPDMDGFKLLELVGLEMDLPVIMLSANGDPKLVMKGITHGACDYLLKPIRIEELKNIWQHVIRRRKIDKKDQYNSENTEKIPPEFNEATSDQKLNKKRKDQNDDEDDDTGHENDDPTAQKKPRVVWSVDLHRKFVAAVNQLGIDKAVPKKILHLMNVENLTRENVASHLQKYRLYLKRISTVANQQAHMVAALGSSDSSYLQMGRVGPGFGFPGLTGSGRFNNPSLPSNGFLTRLNSPASLVNHFPPIMQNDGNALQGMPTSLALESNREVPNGHFLGQPLDWATGTTGGRSNSLPFNDNMTEMPLRSVDNSNNATLDAIYRSNSINSGIYRNGCHLDPNNAVFCGTRSFDSASQPGFGDSSLIRANESQNLALEALMGSNERYSMSQLKNSSGYNPNYFGSLEDIADAMVKQEPNKMRVSDDFGCGLFS